MDHDSSVHGDVIRVFPRYEGVPEAGNSGRPQQAQKGVNFFFYLDDWLVSAPSQKAVERAFAEMIHSTGWASSSAFRSLPLCFCRP